MFQRRIATPPEENVPAAAPVAAPAAETSIIPRAREAVRYPKFANHFARLDFAAPLAPVIALFPVPPSAESPLESFEIKACGLDCQPMMITYPMWQDVPRVRITAPLICQIFNWSEEVTWEGVRLVDFLDHVGLDTSENGFFSIHSRDEHYFEGFSRNEARDPRTLLATTINGQPLPPEHGGPLRLVVPFLQGYKSVKWVANIQATRHDPVGIKRLLGQSKTGRLGRAWREHFDIVPPEGPTGDPD